jgi:protein ImuA
MGALPKHVESIHPALWRATQLACAYGKTIDTGYAALSEQVPGGGWPVGTMTELLLQQAGVGEIRLLGPALVTVCKKRPIALVSPQQLPNAQGYAYVGIDPDKLMWLKTAKSSDALWGAEQILRTGSCGALVLWQQHIRAESLRRLLLAAQSSETLFVIMRPLACAHDSSPAPLRLAVRPAADGVAVEVIKRKGPASAEPIIVKLLQSPNLMSQHRRAPRRIVELPVPAVEHAAVSE